MTDLEWMTPVDDPTRPERDPKKCRHPRWLRVSTPEGQTCGSCQKALDPVAARRRGVVIVDLDDWVSLHGKDGL